MFCFMVGEFALTSGFSDVFLLLPKLGRGLDNYARSITVFRGSSGSQIVRGDYIEGKGMNRRFSFRIAKVEEGC
jgi:hypothetical protein